MTDLDELADAATRRPWRVEQPSGLIVTDYDGDTVAVCRGAWDSDPKADAALIVAAVNAMDAVLRGLRLAEVDYPEEAQRSEQSLFRAGFKEGARWALGRWRQTVGS